MGRHLSKVAVFLAAILFASLGFAQGPGGTWRDLASMPTARQEMACAVLNGKIYVLGGYDKNIVSTEVAEVYNPVTNTWSAIQPLPTAVNHNSAAVAAGRLYSFGAVGTQVLVYQEATNTWAEVAPSLFQHGRTAAVGVFNEKIYVAGGVHGAADLTALEVYDPATNTWTNLAPMTVARNHTGGAFVNGIFYVVGGRGGAGAPTALEAYSPLTNSWTTRAPMPTGRSGIGVAGVNGELWVFGGEIPELHGEVEAYNPSTNTWRSLAPMPGPRHGIWTAVIGDRIYLPGGGVAQNFAATSGQDVFTVDRKATFANISTRLRVGSGDNVLIGGFIVTGLGSKRILVRAPGPSVPVSGALVDPVLELYDGTGRLLATNDNWQDAANRQEIIDSGVRPSQDSESAILLRVAPGNYTAVVRGANASTGVALVEVYDLEAGSEATLANISTRGSVETGDNVLIGGLILTGTAPRRVIVRAIGPSLPVAGALADPNLELRNANGALLASNDNWRSNQQAEIIATMVPPSNDAEAAIVATLPPGPHTAIVRGAGMSTGVALVEAYALD